MCVLIFMSERTLRLVCTKYKISTKYQVCISINALKRDMSRVSTGIPGYSLQTEMIRKFFPFPLWKRFWKSGTISVTIFSVIVNFRNIGLKLRNAPECCFGKFRFTEKSFLNSSGKGSRKTLKTS